MLPGGAEAELVLKEWDIIDILYLFKFVEHFRAALKAEAIFPNTINSWC